MVARPGYQEGMREAFALWLLRVWHPSAFEQIRHYPGNLLTGMDLRNEIDRLTGQRDKLQLALLKNVCVCGMTDLDPTEHDEMMCPYVQIVEQAEIVRLY